MSAEEAYRRERRRLAREHHPDAGGDPAAFREALAELDARRTAVPAAPAPPDSPRSSLPPLVESTVRRLARLVHAVRSPRRP